MTPIQASALRRLIVKFATETILNEQDKARPDFTIQPGATAVELAGQAVNDFITSITLKET